MSFRNSLAAARAFALVLCLALSGFWAASGPASALTAAATVRDANSIQLGDVTYRLDGIDAPEFDQTCIDDHADPWSCGVDARDPIKANIKSAAADARSASAGIWKGCFVAPQEFRTGKKDGALLGAACRSDRDKEIRGVLFPDELTAPPSCAIKGKLAVRARVTGNIGIYHLRGCPSYAATTKPDRWFCSEDDAQASGFRKAYNCRRPK